MRGPPDNPYEANVEPGASNEPEVPRTKADRPDWAISALLYCGLFWLGSAVPCLPYLFQDGWDWEVLAYAPLAVLLFAFETAGFPKQPFLLLLTPAAMGVIRSWRPEVHRLLSIGAFSTGFLGSALMLSQPYLMYMMYRVMTDA